MNVFIGLTMLILGGISAGSCYVPLKKVTGWAWESMWTVQGLVAWLVLPLLLALLVTPHLWQVISAVPASTLFYTYLFGFCWGIGGLAWGIAVRYIGIALGFTIATGFLSSLGTLVPIVAAGQLGAMLSTLPGKITLLSVLVSLIGIVICGRAGMLRDREKQAAALRQAQGDSSAEPAQGSKEPVLSLSKDQTTNVTLSSARPEPVEGSKGAVNQPPQEKSLFKKGVFIAFMAGVLGACFAFGIHTGDPIKEKAIALGASPIWATSPVFFIELLGGITVNLGYCLWMNTKNKSFGDYIHPGPDNECHPEPVEGPVKSRHPELVEGRSALARNYAFSTLTGTLWYLQFVFFGMAAFYMGKYSFTNWSIHMSFMVVASNLWGYYYREWSGVSRKTFRMNITGIIILVIAGIIMGIASYVKGVGS